MILIRKLLLPLMAAFCLLLSGCVEADIGVKIDANNGGSLSATLLIDKELYTMMSESGEMTGLGGMTEGETTVDGTVYKTFTKTGTYQTYQALEYALMNMKFLESSEGETPKLFKSVKIQKDRWLLETKYTFQAVTNTQEPVPEMSEPDMDFSSMIKLHLNIIMPDKINEASGGVIQGNTLVCDILSLTSETEITAVSKSFNVTAVIVGAIMLISLTALIILLSKKKGKTAAD
jgi:SepF-like predicted cell division protein (DUF552 family)